MPIAYEDMLCQQYLALIYQDIRDSIRLPTSSKHAISETYGHILFPSIMKLLSHITLTEQDVFIDLGSGSGNALLQIFLQTSVKEVYGIEISPKLHQQALASVTRLKKDLPQFFMGDRKIQFILGDFLKTPISMGTVAFLVSTCFGQDILFPIVNIINDTPTIRTVISLRPLCNLDRLPLKKIISVEGTWDSALCYIYGDK